MSAQATKQNVVVVGGGGSGAVTARLLSQKLDPAKHTLTLISARPFGVHYPGSIRMTTTSEQHLEEKCLFTYEKLFDKGFGTIKIAKVVGLAAHKGEVKGGTLTLEGGETVPYDVLVLAPGSLWQGAINFPNTKDEVLAHVHAWREKFKNAKSVVLVGGGAVGQEFAGELRDFHPDTKVTIVHSDKLLLNGAYPDKFRTRLAKDLRARGVNLVLDDFVDTTEVTNGKVVTRGGKEIEADLILLCRGGRPATEWLKGQLDSDTLNKEGRIRVEPTLQVKGYPSIFSVGDATDWKEQKQVGKYPVHSAVVSENVLAYLAGKTPEKLYKGNTEIIFVTNGRYWGLGYVDILWGVVVNHFLVSWIKGRRLLVSMQRATFGLT